MIPKKQPAKEEPFLNTVARKLGHAAGTLTNVAQEFTENVSALPKAVSTKVLQTATTITNPLNRPQSKKKSRRATRTRSAKGAATARKRRPAATRSPRRVKAANRKKNK